MDFLLLQAFAILRPVFFVDVNQRLLGMPVFDVAAMILVGMMALSLLVTMTLRKRIEWSAIDTLIVAYIAWCIAVALIYPQLTDFRELAKQIAPFVGYTVAKNVLRSRDDYLKMLFLLLLGFALPMLGSAALISAGGGVDYESYWTGVKRYAGLYISAHTFGHNAGFLAMLLVIYFILRRVNNGAENTNEKPYLRVPIFYWILAACAVYGLAMSQVRTVYLGLFVFFAVLLFYVSKKWLVAGMVALFIGLMVSGPVVELVFRDVVEVHRGERSLERIGSGRPFIWRSNLQEFSQLSLDRQIAGAGLGIHRQGENFRNSHNDFLDVLVQTGIVGFLIFMALQVAFLARIMRLPLAERHLFLALFAAVTFMNLASNSYIARYGLGQMFYVVLAYLELARPAAALAATTRSERSAGKGYRAQLRRRRA